MPIFEWKPEYETGIHDIDEQHQYLVSLINRLDQLIHAPQASSDDTVADLEELYTELFDYTVYHFNYEEQLMEQSGYASASMTAHKKQHDQFILELKSVLNDFQDVKLADGKVILSFLTNWLINHICKIDKKLAKHVLAQAQPNDPAEPATASTTDTMLTDYQDDRHFLGLFMDFSEHLSHHLSQVEKQLTQLRKQLSTDAEDEPLPVPKKLTERIMRRVRIVRSLVGNLESSAKSLRKNKKS